MTRAGLTHGARVQSGEGVNEAHHLVVGQHERIAAGEEHVAHVGMLLDVVDASGEVLVGAHDVRVSEESLARAVAAVHEAAVAGHYEDAVWEALLEAGADGIFLLFAEGVGSELVVLVGLAQIGLELPGEAGARLCEPFGVWAGEAGV